MGGQLRACASESVPGVVLVPAQQCRRPAGVWWGSWYFPSHLLLCAATAGFAPSHRIGMALQSFPCSGAEHGGSQLGSHLVKMTRRLKRHEHQQNKYCRHLLHLFSVIDWNRYRTTASTWL